MVLPLPIDGVQQEKPLEPREALLAELRDAPKTLTLEVSRAGLWQVDLLELP